MATTPTTRVSRSGLSLTLPAASVSALTGQGIRAAAQELLKLIDERSRRIIARRFGVENGIPKTLHAIGVEEGVTRERIRQIEYTVFQSFHELEKRGRVSATLTAVRAGLNELLRSLGGVAREDVIIDLLHLTSETEYAALRLLLRSLPGVTDVRETTRRLRHYRGEETLSVETILEAAQDALTTARKLLPDEELFARIREKIGTAPETTALRSVLSIARNIVRTPYGEWGLKGWTEATPRGVGDKAYVVLKRAAEPRHFTAITDAINETRFDRRTAHAQTVHNELIRDERFVLVGRGLYALKEWGYQPGTVSDVLERILQESGVSLTRDELMDRVLKERLVKRNTILLALQNRERFLRQTDGRFSVAKKNNRRGEHTHPSQDEVGVRAPVTTGHGAPTSPENTQRDRR